MGDIFTAPCHVCARSPGGDCGGPHWVVEPYGFDAHTYPAKSAAQARWRSYSAGHEVGYFRDFHDFLTRGVIVRRAA